MKVIKNILLFCFLLFGIIMQTEIFQNELWNFETTYFQASRFEVPVCEGDFTSPTKNAKINSIL